jgi:hypothetical protein
MAPIVQKLQRRAQGKKARLLAIQARFSDLPVLAWFSSSPLRHAEVEHRRKTPLLRDEGRRRFNA